MSKRIHKKIGGEFEIDPKFLEDLNNYRPKKSFSLYSSGRCALMAILQKIRKTNPRIIHIPYYICPSVVTACRVSGFEIKFYEPDEFQFPLNQLHIVKINETVLTVTYFGIIDDNEIIKIIKKKRPDIFTISDRVQSFWTFEQSEADYSFTSFRKHYATPDGAAIFSKYYTDISPRIRKDNEFYLSKLSGAILKHFQVTDEIFLYFLREGEKILDKSLKITKASKLGLFIYDNTNFGAIKEKRRTNYRFLYEQGVKYGLNFIFPYNNEVIPLCAPIILDNRDKVKEKLKKSDIYLPVHWPLENYNQKSELAKKMAEKELSLIVDQRYSQKDLQIILEKITK